MKIKYEELCCVLRILDTGKGPLFNLDLRPEKSKTTKYSHFSSDDLVPIYNRLKSYIISIEPSIYLFSNTLKKHDSRLLFFPIP